MIREESSVFCVSFCKPRASGDDPLVMDELWRILR